MLQVTCFAPGPQVTPLRATPDADPVPVLGAGLAPATEPGPELPEAPVAGPEPTAFEPPPEPA